MSAIVDRLRQLNHLEVKLEDGGLVVGYHLPDIEECLLAGEVPLNALAHLPPRDDTPVEPEMTGQEMDDSAARMVSFKKRLVGAMLDDVDGIAVGPEDGRAAIVEAFSPSQRQELYLIANREKDPNSGEA